VTPKLSILIPTVYGREKQFNSLVSSLKNQIQELYSQERISSFDEVEILAFIDDKTMTIGEKREQLYKMAKGEYSLQVDDDDGLHKMAIAMILEVIKQKPDCVTYQENCLMNGNYYSCNHSLKYDDWQDNLDGYDYVRTPFYKDVIKTEIARSVPFEYIRYGEDHAWSRALKPHLKNEIHIDQELYFYIHNSKPEEFQERYGFVK
jgi:hypothetical protein